MPERLLSDSVPNEGAAEARLHIGAGKVLAARQTEITIRFKQALPAFFRSTSVARLTPCDLTLHMQPGAGISPQFGAKQPGPDVQTGALHCELTVHAGGGFGSIVGRRSFHRHEADALAMPSTVMVIYQSVLNGARAVAAGESAASKRWGV